MVHYSVKLILLFAFLHECLSFGVVRSRLSRSGNLLMAQNSRSQDALLFEKLQSKLATKNSEFQPNDAAPVNQAIERVEPVAQTLPQPSEDKEVIIEAIQVPTKKEEAIMVVEKAPVYQKIKSVDPNPPQSSLPSLNSLNPSFGLVFAGAVASVAAFFAIMKKNTSKPKTEDKVVPKSPTKADKKPVAPIAPKATATPKAQPKSPTPALSNQPSSVDLKSKAIEEKARIVARKEEDRRQAIAKALAEEEARRQAEEKAKNEAAATAANVPESSSKLVLAWEAKRAAAKAAAEAEARKALARAKVISAAKIKEEAEAKEISEAIPVSKSEAVSVSKVESLPSQPAPRATQAPVTNEKKAWATTAKSTGLPNAEPAKSVSKPPAMTENAKSSLLSPKSADAGAKVKVTATAAPVKPKAEEEARQVAAAAAAKAKTEEEARQVAAAAAAKAKAEEEARQVAAATAATTKAEEEARQVAAAAATKAKAEEEARQVAAAAAAKAKEEVIFTKLKEYDSLSKSASSLQERASIETERNEFKRTEFLNLRKERAMDARLKAGIVDIPTSPSPASVGVSESADEPKVPIVVPISQQASAKASVVEVEPKKPPTNSLSNEQVEALRAKADKNVKENQARRQMLQEAKDLVKEAKRQPEQKGTQPPSLATVTSEKNSVPVQGGSKAVELTGLNDTLDQMEAAAESNIPSGRDGISSADVLDNIVTALSKLPIAKMRDLIAQNGGTLSQFPRTADIGDYLEVAIPLFWTTSKRNWNSFVTFVDKEVSPTAQVNSEYMKAAILTASSKEFTDRRIKDLIKKYKDSSAVPKSKRDDDDVEKQEADRLEYIGAFLDVLRVKYENDYRLVNETVQQELAALIKNKPKGFGGASATTASRK